MNLAYHPIVHSISRSLLGLVLFAGVCFAVASFSALFPPDAWYAGLRKPTWQPPDAIFAPVWTVLYTLMALAAWMVWERVGVRGARRALTLFALQLLFNGAWTWLFFGLHRLGWALIDIIALWLVILATLVLFARVRLLAGALLLPYLAWVAFAGVLNFTLWRLNS